MADQLEEYRRQMQQRYRGAPPSSNPPPPARPNASDEEYAKRLQEEENKRRLDQLREDEELARKLQGSYPPAPAANNPYGTPVYPPPPGNNAYSPPAYIPAGQPVPPPYVPPQSYPPQSYPAGNYPPPQNYPPQGYPPANYQPLPNNPPGGSQNRFSYQASRSSGQANPAGQGCLPQVQDKCLGINTQVCVLASAAIMTIGIIATLIALSA